MSNTVLMFYGLFRAGILSILNQESGIWGSQNEVLHAMTNLRESKSTTHCERHLSWSPSAKLDDANFLRQCAGPLREGNATTRIANLHMVRVSLGSKCWFEARCEPKHLLYKLHTYYPCKHLLVNFCSARSRTMIDTVGFCPDMELLPDCNAPQKRFEWLCLHMLVQSIV